MAAAGGPETPARKRSGRAARLLASSQVRELSMESISTFDKSELLAKALLMQFDRVTRFMPSGMHVLPDDEDPMVWHGAIFVPPGGMYANCAATFMVRIADTFPREGAVPEVTFLKFPRHPLVNPSSGRFALQYYIPEWKLETELCEVFRAVKLAFTPTRKQEEAMCDSTVFEDAKTVDMLGRDRRTLASEIAAMARPLRESLLRPPAPLHPDPLGLEGSAPAGGGRNVFPAGGFHFTAPAPEHARLSEFLAAAPGGKGRTAWQIQSFIESLERDRASGVDVGGTGGTTAGDGAAGPGAAASASAAEEA